jgi:hypothetical protein
LDLTNGFPHTPKGCVSMCTLKQLECPLVHTRILGVRAHALQYPCHTNALWGALVTTPSTWEYIAINYFLGTPGWTKLVVNHCVLQKIVELCTARFNFSQISHPVLMWISLSQLQNSTIFQTNLQPQSYSKQSTISVTNSDPKTTSLKLVF